MKRTFGAVALLAVTSPASAQMWIAGADGVAVPASISGASLPGAMLRCRADAFTMTLSEATIGDGTSSAPVALLIDGKLFSTSAAPDGKIKIPSDAIPAMKSGKKLTLSYPSGGRTTETAFALRGSGKALDALRQNCPKGDVPEEITANGATIKVADSYRAGSAVAIPFMPPAKPNRYWIGFVPVGAGPKDFMSFGYTYTSSGNPAVVTAPAQPGSYEIRMFDNTDKKVIMAKTITITEPAPAKLEAPTSTAGGSRLSIAHSGPDGPSNVVVIVKAGAPDGRYHSYQQGEVRKNPTTVRTPSTGGDYEVRYLLRTGKANVLARLPLKVSEAPTVTLQDIEAAPGAQMAIALGADAPRISGDYIYIAKPGAPDNSYKGGYTSVSTKGEIKLNAPKEAGEWEIRYVAPDNGSWKSLGRAKLTVK